MINTCVFTLQNGSIIPSTMIYVTSVYPRRLTYSWSGRIYSYLVWLRQASLSVKRHSTWC